MSSVQEIVELSERICNRIDEIIAMDRRMNDEMMEYLEHVGWNMQKQTEDIKQVYERFGE
jgi:hypothetical protein